LGYLREEEMATDLVLGSRCCNKREIRGWNRTRLLVNKVTNRITGMIIKLPSSDYTTGFRCYSKDYIVKALPKLHSQIYGIQMRRLQAKLQNSKVSKIAECFKNRKKGKSKLSLTEIAGFSTYFLKVIWEQPFEIE
jgi:dolichol-phosphate mannosyltransferase